MKNQIRLREFEKNEIIHKSPSLNYVNKTRHLSNNISYRAQTDSNGYIISGRIFEPTKKICIIGASLIENMFVKESHKWNTYLEKIFLQNGNLYKIYNAGYSGATSLNILNTLLNKVYISDFDSIIYVISSNDYSATAYEKSYWNLTKNHSNLYLSEYEEEKRYYGNRKEHHFDALIKSIYTTALHFNQDFWLATYPNLSKNSALDKLNARLRILCKENNFNLIDIDLLMVEKNIYYEENFYDDLHLSERGTVVFSEILYSFIEKNYLIKRSNSKIVTKELFIENPNIIYGKGLNIDETIHHNNIHKKISFNIVLDISTIQTKSKTKEEILVKLHFNDKNNILADNNLLYTEEEGWHFYITEPINKNIETSYHFEVSFKGSLFIEFKCKNDSSITTIDSVNIETIEP
ncbi:SGNH/GDSL hydrolase family protein [Psychrobacter sp. FME2]|nr:SGNH/GDSL hydrolase family protein [Pseudomonas lundensis]